MHQVAAVLVVTDDHVLARELADCGAEVIPDGAADDLNASLVQAAAELLRRHPGLHLAALCADLPALRPGRPRPGARRGAARPDGLRRRRRRGRHDRRHRARPGRRSDPASATARAPSTSTPGAREIDLDGLESLRRDVDTPADLAEVLRLGIGPRTSRVAAGLF